MKNKIIIWMALGAVTAMSACGPVEFRDPIGGSDQIPEPITVRSIRPFSGGATVYYQLPKDDNLKSITASYTPNSEGMREVRASAFVDSIVLYGFDHSAEYQVELYSVSQREKKSAPLPITVHPLDPPYQVAASTLATGPIFGGINLSYDNPASTELEVSVLTRIEDGGKVAWNMIDQFNTASPHVNYDMRGLAAEPTHFGFIIKDRYNNTSDTLYSAHTPYFEQKIDKSRFTPYPAGAYVKTAYPNYGTPLPGDIWVQHMSGSTVGVHGLYDDKVGLNANLYFTKSTSGIPQGVTIDLGRKCKLSRIVLWCRANEASKYGHAFPSHIAIYGSNNPSPTGIQTVGGVKSPDPSWTLFEDYICTTPSGAQLIKDVTDADREYIVNNGHTYNIPADAEAFRYIRLWTKVTWDTSYQAVVIGEMDVYGDYVD